MQFRPHLQGPLLFSSAVSCSIQCHGGKTLLSKHQNLCSQPQLEGPDIPISSSGTGLPRAHTLSVFFHLPFSYACMYPSISLSIHQSISLSIYPFVCPSINQLISISNPFTIIGASQLHCSLLGQHHFELKCSCMCLLFQTENRVTMSSHIEKCLWGLLGCHGNKQSETHDTQEIHETLEMPRQFVVMPYQIL